jgi:hypothetical protein
MKPKTLYYASYCNLCRAYTQHVTKDGNLTIACCQCAILRETLSAYKSHKMREEFDTLFSPDSSIS